MNDKNMSNISFMYIALTLSGFGISTFTRALADLSTALNESIILFIVSAFLFVGAGIALYIRETKKID